MGGGWVVALLLVGIAFILYRFLSKPSDLYGLDHMVLNLADPPLWLNMGLWGKPEKRAGSFTDAARAMTEAVGRAARLENTKVLLDVGYGCGEQDLFWAGCHPHLRIIGATLEETQSLVARRRVAGAGLDDRVQLACFSADNVPQLVAKFQNGDFGRSEGPPDSVIALDCAYHFNTRDRFLRSIFATLPAGGSLGMADIILGEGQSTHWIGKLLMNLAHRGVFIPRENLVTSAQYEAQLRAIGYIDISIEDVTDQVFFPLALWLERQVSLFAPLLKFSIRYKYSLLARILRAIDSQRLFRFIIVSARTPQH